MQKPIPTSDTADQVRFSLASAQHWESSIEAWAYIDDKAAASAAPAAGPLAGVPFAVKDIIDVAGLPTRFGCDAFADREPARSDAAVVAALRAAGAIPLGKTRTTAFAFTDPSITRNPHQTEHSPGGSSSGSGAVVGAGIVPFALGTQTAGSLCRPASFCGAASYKPGLGILPTDGVAPLARSFDAVGIIAQSMDWLARIFPVLAQAFSIPRSTEASDGSLRIACIISPDQKPEPVMREAMDSAVNQLQTIGHQIETICSPVSFSDLIDHHRIIMLAEAARDLLPIIGNRRPMLPPQLAAALQAGESILPSEYASAAQQITTARSTFWNTMVKFDVLLAYPVPGPAPKGLSTTGDQTYLTPWTALGGPLISLPNGCDSNRMPVAILLAAAPGRDAMLINAASQLAAVLPDTPAPQL